jgi:hypothetical protein
MRLARCLLLTLSFCWLTACATAAVAPESEPSAHEKAYYFQHRLLPKWTHNSKGAFFSDLKKGEAVHLKAVAKDFLGETYASEITTRTLQDGNAVLISFPKPAEVPECFHVIIIREEDAYRFVTLELTEDIAGIGCVSVVGEWTADGGHQNRGPRKYSDSEAFVAEVLANKKTS